MLAFTSAGNAELRVVTTYPYIADLVRHTGGDRVTVTAMARGDRDPHMIVPRPSNLALLRRADLLIINGAELEIGWLPPLVYKAANTAIKAGSEGFLDLSTEVKLIQVPEKVSRAHGDVHPSGNPHYSLDPQNIPVLARAIARRLGQLDPDGKEHYHANQEKFITRWNTRMEEWKNRMAPLRGKKVVEYHMLYDYFLQRYGLEAAGTLEPKPGIPPSGSHIRELIKRCEQGDIFIILQDVYHPDRPSRMVSEKTGVPWIVLPHDVGAVEQADDIFLLFDEITGRISR